VEICAKIMTMSHVVGVCCNALLNIMTRSSLRNARLKCSILKKWRSLTTGMMSCWRRLVVKMWIRGAEMFFQVRPALVVPKMFYYDGAVVL
jgi:hypothetical protein